MVRKLLYLICFVLVLAAGNQAMGRNPLLRQFRWRSRNAPERDVPDITTERCNLGGRR